MTRETTLHGVFKCECGNGTCTVGTRHLRCPKCGRLYKFYEVPRMIERAWYGLTIEAKDNDVLIKRRPLKRNRR